MNVLDFVPIDHAFCVRVVATLAHFLWQGAALALVAAAASLAFRRAPSQARYAAFVAALVLMAACPVITFIALGSGPARSPEPAALNTSRVQEPRAETCALPVDPTPSLTGDESPGGPAQLNALVTVKTGPASAPAQEPRPLSAQSWPWRFDWRPYAAYMTAAYFGAVLAMMARLLVALCGGGRLRRRSEPLTDAAVLEALARQARDLGLRFTPAIACCARVAVPTVVGVIRPMVLLPASVATGLAAEQVELLLLHELAHIRRHDHWVNMLQRLVEAVLFLHPAVWYVSRRIRIEREHCCDDLVVGHVGEARPYAESLVRVAAFAHAHGGAPAPLAALGAADRSSQLRRRIGRLLGAPTPPVRLAHGGWLLVALAVLVAAAALVQMGAVSDQAPPTGASAENTVPTEPPPPPAVPESDVTLEDVLKAAGARSRAGASGEFTAVFAEYAVGVTSGQAAYREGLQQFDDTLRMRLEKEAPDETFLFVGLPGWELKAWREVRYAYRGDRYLADIEGVLQPQEAFNEYLRGLWQGRKLPLYPTEQHRERVLFEFDGARLDYVHGRERHVWSDEGWVAPLSKMDKSFILWDEIPPTDRVRGDQELDFADLGEGRYSYRLTHRITGNVAEQVFNLNTGMLERATHTSGDGRVLEQMRWLAPVQAESGLWYPRLCVHMTEHGLVELRLFKDWQFRPVSDDELRIPESEYDSEAHRQPVRARSKEPDEDARRFTELVEQLDDADWWLRKVAAVQLAEAHQGRAVVEALIEALKDEDKRVQAAAAKGLGEIVDPKAIKHLVAALKEKKPVRDAAAEALSHFDAADLMPLLRLAAADEDWDVRAGAVAALSRLDTPEAMEVAVSAICVRYRDGLGPERDRRLSSDYAPAVKRIDRQQLLAALAAKAQQPDPDIRMAVANVLHELKDPDAAGTLGKLAEDASSEVRYHAVSACADILTQQAPEEAADVSALEQILRKALRDDSRETARSAAMALGKAGWAPENDEERAWDLVARESWNEALALGEAAQDAFLKALTADWSQQPRPERRGMVPGMVQTGGLPETVVYAVGRLRDRRAVPILVKMVRQAPGAPSAPYAAAWALGEIGEPAAVEPLIAALQSAPASLRHEVARALGKLDDARAVAPLMDALTDPEADVQAKAAEALGALGATEAVAPLCALAVDKDTDANVRSAAAKALGQIADLKAREVLVEVLAKDANEKVRTEAATSLGTLGDTEAIPPLLDAFLYDPKGAVAETAAMALAGIGGPSAVAALEEAAMSQRSTHRLGAIIAALVEIPGSEAGDALFGLLEDAPTLGARGREHHIAIARALAERGDPRAEELLQGLRQTPRRFEAEEAMDVLRSKAPADSETPDEGEAPASTSEGSEELL